MVQISAASIDTKAGGFSENIPTITEKLVKVRKVVGKSSIDLEESTQVLQEIESQCSKSFDCHSFARLFLKQRGLALPVLNLPPMVPSFYKKQEEGAFLASVKSWRQKHSLLQMIERDTYEKIRSFSANFINSSESFPIAEGSKDHNNRALYGALTLHEGGNLSHFACICGERNKKLELLHSFIILGMDESKTDFIVIERRSLLAPVRAVMLSEVMQANRSDYADLSLRLLAGTVTDLL